MEAQCSALQYLPRKYGVLDLHSCFAREVVHDLGAVHRMVQAFAWKDPRSPEPMLRLGYQAIGENGQPTLLADGLMQLIWTGQGALL